VLVDNTENGAFTAIISRRVKEDVDGMSSEDRR